jgi:hypothetical protein
MSLAFGLLFVYDRRNPAPDAPTRRPRVVYVTPPPGTTLNGTESQRLAASLHAWIRENNRPIVTPPPQPPTTVVPNANIENPPSTANGEVDADARST